MLIRELLESKKKDTIALTQGEKTLTYNQWNMMSQNLSKKIEDIIKDTSLTVGIFLKNSINYAVSYFGILYANRIIVPIGIQAKEPEILSTIEYCEIDIIISDSMNAEFLIECLNQYKYKVYLYIVDTEEIIAINEEKEMISKSNEIDLNGDEDDVVIMLHTSGTTSNPKRVMLSSQNLICNIISNIESLGLTEQDKVLIALPMFFGYCNTAQFLTHIYLGSPIVILDNIFMPRLFFEIVEKERITCFTGVPTMLLMLLNYRYYYNYDFTSLRYICFGGGIMPIEKLRQLIYKYKSIGFVHTYGQTECSPRITALLPNQSIEKIGSVGKALPGIEVQIVDMNGDFLKEMEIGEIVVKGNNVMKGYYKQRRKTEEIIQKGWIHTGDLGYFDRDGYLFLTGRLKNIIISGGINIYPEEIEQILLQHECVEDVVVMGKPHHLLGEVPVAKIVRKSEVDEEELKRFCRIKVAGYKVPVEFEYVEKLDRTYNGKIKRNMNS